MVAPMAGNPVVKWERGEPRGAGQDARDGMGFTMDREKPWALQPLPQGGGSEDMALVPLSHWECGPVCVNMGLCVSVLGEVTLWLGKGLCGCVGWGWHAEGCGWLGGTCMAVCCVVGFGGCDAVLCLANDCGRMWCVGLCLESCDVRGCGVWRSVCMWL